MQHDLVTSTSPPRETAHQQRHRTAAAAAPAGHLRHKRCVTIGAGAVGATKAVSDSLAAALVAADTPLWLLGVRCLGSAAAATCAAMAISRLLHQIADREDAGEVRLRVCRASGSEYRCARFSFGR